MEATVFNPAQQHILELLSFVKTQDQLDELKSILASYFAQKVDEEMDMLTEQGLITEQTIEEWGQEHMRTPYKKWK